MHATRGMRLAWLFPAAIVLAILVAVGTTLVRTRPGVHVTVVNHGPQPLQTVALHVTGRVHVLGDLPPGQAQTRKVLPTGESHLEIEHTDEHGQRQRLKVDCYLEPGSRGTIRVEVRAGRIAEVANNVSVGAD